MAIGPEVVAEAISAPIESGKPWAVVGIKDLELAQVAHALGDGAIRLPGYTRRHRVPITQIKQLGQRGPVHRDIVETTRSGQIRGPFTKISPPASSTPTYPMLWAHDAKRERSLIVAPDSEGQIKQASELQEEINVKASRIWSSASRVHYTANLQFNAQSLISSITEQRSIGGSAWPTVSLNDSGHTEAFVLWCNSTFGLLLHWWTCNKTQSGRGLTPITTIPEILTLDTRALTDEQHLAAMDAFDALRDLRFLPFDQIDEDPARAELDRRLLVDVLGLPPSLCDPDGPIDLLRRKLAREPQIHGGKKSRVVFTDKGEKTEKRRDRD